MNITIKEAAKRLNVQQYILYNLVKQKKIKIIRNPMRVNFNELTRLFAKYKPRKPSIKRFDKPAEKLTPIQKEAVEKIRHVIVERKAGKTFAEIGSEYGMSRQAAHYLYDRYKFHWYYRFGTADEGKEAER